MKTRADRPVVAGILMVLALVPLPCFGQAPVPAELPQYLPRFLKVDRVGLTSRGESPTSSTGREFVPVFQAEALRPVVWAEQDRSQGGPSQAGWIKRHPALFGALVGAGTGALAGGTLGEDCCTNGGCTEGFCSRPGMVTIGTLAGTGVGALTGWITGLVDEVDEQADSRNSPSRGGSCRRFFCWAR